MVMNHDYFRDIERNISYQVDEVEEQRSILPIWHFSMFKVNILE